MSFETYRVSGLVQRLGFYPSCVSARLPATLSPSTTDKTSWTKPLHALTHRASIYMGILSRRCWRRVQREARDPERRDVFVGAGQRGPGGPTAPRRLGFRDRHASIVHELRNLPRQRFSSTFRLLSVVRLRAAASDAVAEHDG